MSVIGLTGGIAAGKSTASEILREFGAVIIDADRLGHRSYEPGTPGFEKVVNAFGHDVVGKDGTIDRRILGGKVFGAPGELQRLNALIWPEIRTLIREEIAQLRAANRNTYIVLEAAVLIEAGWQDLCDEIWVIHTSTRTAVDRLRSRNGLTEEAALARINSQMSTRDRLSHADVKIDNSDSEVQLRQRMEKAWKAFLDRQRKAAPASRVKPAAKSTTRAAAAKSPTTRAVAAKTAPRAATRAVAAKAPAKLAPKATTKAASKAAVQPASKATTKAAPKAVAKAVSKAVAKAVSKTAPAKPSARAAAKPAAKAPQKTQTRVVAKPAARTTTAKTIATRATSAAKQATARPAARAGASRK